MSYLGCLGTAWSLGMLPGLWMKGTTSGNAPEIRVWGVAQLSWEAGHSPFLPTAMMCTWAFGVCQSCEEEMATGRMMMREGWVVDWVLGEQNTEGGDSPSGRWDTHPLFNWFTFLFLSGEIFII